MLYLSELVLETACSEIKSDNLKITISNKVINDKHEIANKL